MRLLVTGAGGQLGRDLVRAARRAGHDASGRARSALDVTDPAAIEAALAETRPEAVLNCAAYTDVDGAELRPQDAWLVNAEAPGRLARACAQTGALVVHVSTDYVFDGRRDEPYLENDAPNPLSAYGRSKLAGEEAVMAAASRHAIVRSSWLFGAGGRNFVETMLALGAERDEVGVVSDQVGCPTWTAHLAGAVVEIAEREALGLHHVAAEGECSWHEFATEIFRQAALDCVVHEQTTAQLGRPAARPAYSVLRSTRPDTPRLPHWQEGLAGYLAEREAEGAGQPAAHPGPPA